MVRQAIYLKIEAILKNNIKKIKMNKSKEEIIEVLKRYFESRDDVLVKFDIQIACLWDRLW